VSLRELAQAHLQASGDGLSRVLSQCPTAYSVPAGQNAKTPANPGLSAVPPLRDSGTKNQPVNDAGTTGTSGTLGTNGTVGTASLPVDVAAGSERKNRAAVRAGLTDRWCDCGTMATVAIGRFRASRDNPEGVARWLCAECFRRDREARK
jgi:hypothetical protein